MIVEILLALLIFTVIVYVADRGDLLRRCSLGVRVTISFAETALFLGMECWIWRRGPRGPFAAVVIFFAVLMILGVTNPSDKARGDQGNALFP